MATKFENTSPTCFDIYSVESKQVQWKIIFVVFSERWNLIIWFLGFLTSKLKDNLFLQTRPWIMDGQIREKNHQTSKVWAFWAMYVGCPDKIHLC